MQKVVKTAFTDKTDSAEYYEGQIKYNHCDQFLILTNQDDQHAVRAMIHYIRDSKFARTFRAVPAACARLNFAIGSAVKQLSDLIVGEHIIVVFLHNEGYELYILEVVDGHNYTTIEYQFYRELNRCISEFNEFKFTSRKAVIVGMSGTDSDEKASKFGSVVYVTYENYESMIYQGGIAKLEANEQESNEVLDISAVLLADFVSETGLTTTAYIMGCNARQTVGYPKGLVKSMEILFAPEICFISRSLIKCLSRNIIPKTSFNFAVISINVDDYGIMSVEIIDHDEGYIEFTRDIGELPEHFSEAIATEFHLDIKRTF